MAEPDRKVYDDDGYDQPLSAEERANQAWLNNRAPMSDEELDAYNQGDGEALQTARERANQRWGMNSGTDKGSSGSDRPWAAPGSDNASLSEREASGGGKPFGGDSESRSVEDIMSRKGMGGAAAGWATNMATSAASKSNPFAFAVSMLASNKRKALLGGGVTGTIIGLFVFAGMIASGPLQLIHAANLLNNIHFGNNESFSDSRRNNLFFYARNYASGDAHRNNLGYAANKLADKYDKKLADNGIIQNRDNRRSIQSIDIDTNTEAGRRLDAKLRAEGIVPEDIPDQPGKVRVTTRGTGKTKMANNVMDLALDEIGLKGRSGEIAKRLLRKRNGISFRLLQNRVRDKAEDIEDYRKKQREERAKINREGASDIDPKKPEAENRDTNNDDVGDSKDPADVNASRESGDFIDEIDDIDTSTVDGQNKLKNVKTNLLQKLGPAGTAAAGAAAVVGLTCAARDIGNAAEDAQWANNVLPMMRLGFSIMSMGGQAAAGQATIDEIGVVVDDLNDELAKPEARSFFNAQTLQTELGNPNANGPDLPENANPGALSEEPIVLQVLNDIPLLGTACDISTKVGELPIIKQAGEVTNQIVNTGLETVTGKSADDFIDMLIDHLAGNATNVLAQGAELGNLANTGAFLAANEQALSMGGRSLTDREVTELQELKLRERRLENSQKTLFARIIDPKNHESLFAKTVIQNPQLASISASTQKLNNIPGNILNNVASIVSPTVFAQQPKYDYGVAKVGFSVTEMNDERFEDPYANADIVEPKLEQLLDEYGDCFQVSISGGKLTQEEAKPYSERPDKCNDSNEDLLRLRFYIADTVTNKALLCYESIDETACDELGMSSLAADSSSTRSGGGSSIYLVGDSLTVGMRDHGSLQTKLQERGWNVIGIDAVGGRLINWGIEQVEARNDLGAAGTVVINLGTNEGGTDSASFEKRVDNMIAAVRAKAPTAQILWTNLYGEGQICALVCVNLDKKFPELNEILERKSKEHNFTILYWSKSEEAKLHVPNNDVHPNGKYPEMADWLVNQIGSPSGGTVVSGDSKQLAQQIINSGKFSADRRYMNQVEAIANGDNSCNINPTILKILASLVQKHTIYVTSINRFCTKVLTASGANSYHWRDGGGHAVDIGIIDGVSSTGATPKDLEVIREVLQFKPEGIGQVNCRSAAGNSIETPGVRQFNDTCNHLHIQVPIQ